MVRERKDRATLADLVAISSGLGEWNQVTRTFKLCMNCVAVIIACRRYKTPPPVSMYTGFKTMA